MEPKEKNRKKRRESCKKYLFMGKLVFPFRNMKNKTTKNALVHPGTAQANTFEQLSNLIG